jgi:hypothetical protein
MGGSTRAEPNEKPSNAAWMLLLPLLCCGGPALIAAAASAGALGWGALGAGIAVLIAAGVLIARRQVRRSCNAAADRASGHPQAGHVPGGDLSR